MDTGSSNQRGLLGYATLNELVYSRLKDDILFGRYRDRERLVQRQIAERLGVSRAPVRDAIRRLEAEGLVTESPRAGHSVADISKDELADLYLVREVLEVVAAKLAAKHATPAQVNAMTESLRQLEEAVGHEEPDRSYRLGSQFHELLAESSGNTVLQELLRNVWDRVLRYRIAATLIPGRAREGLSDHYEILERIEAKDADGAGEVMKRHIDESRRRISLGIDQSSRGVNHE